MKRETMMRIFLFVCGFSVGQAGVGLHYFGWKGMIPSALALALMIVTLIRGWRRSCRKCGHLQSVHCSAGCLFRVDFYKERFCECSVNFEQVNRG